LRKIAAWVAGLVVAGLVAVAAVNHVRLDAGTMAVSAERVVERAQALSQRARPEYQEVALASLPPNPRNGPGYRLDEMLDRAVLVEPPAPPADDSGVVFALDFTNGTEHGLRAIGSIPLEQSNGRLVTGGGSETSFLATRSDLAIPSAEIGDIVIRARVDRGNFLRLGWIGARRTERDAFLRYKLDVRVNADNAFHTYVVNGRNVLQRGLRSGEPIAQLLLIPSDDPDARVEIEFVRLLSRAARFALAPNGADYEQLGGEQRRVLYMRPDQTLEYTLEIPRDEPRLDLGTGILLDGRPLRFAVELVGDHGAAVLLDQTIATAEAWNDHRIDLSPWAGQSIKLRLRVTGDAGNVGFWSAPRISSKPVKPLNIVVMIEDAQRADYLSVYGHPTRTTPFKEELMAERGILFQQALSQATKTRPSVASFMTSLYPTATGLWHFTDVLSERHLTLAEVLRSQGYETAAFVQNGNAGPFAGLHQGFDRFFGEFITGPRTADVFGGPRVVSWLEENKDRNFFLYLHAIDPHAPYDPEEPFRSQYLARIRADARPITAHPVYDPPWLESPSIDSRRRLYEAEIEANDAQVRNFFALLERMGLAENTLVIMASDHGEFLGERSVFGNRLWDHRPPGYMATTHVPFMMVYPERFREPKRIAAPVQLLDMMPTILELAEVDREPLLLQGDSLVPLIEGQDPDFWRNRLVLSEEPTAMEKGDPCSCGSVYFRDWHIISSRYFFPRNRTYQPAPHLQTFAATFALKVAPDARGEELSPTFVPDLLFRWRHGKTLSRLRAANMATFATVTANDQGAGVIDPETLDRLRGLGYVN
jgi:arylsulfatase A-like enzyme